MIIERMKFWWCIIYKEPYQAKLILDQLSIDYCIENDEIKITHNCVYYKNNKELPITGY